MRCRKCKHFKLIKRPYDFTPHTMIFGQAKCDKYGWIIEFANMSKLTKLTEEMKKQYSLECEK